MIRETASSCSYFLIFVGNTIRMENEVERPEVLGEEGARNIL
jgi:hypothetical protein